LPITPNAKSYIKNIAYALLGIIAAAIGVLAVGAYGDHFETNPVRATVVLSQSLGIDVFGALFPFIIALGSMILFLLSVKTPAVKIVISLVASTAFAFVLFHPTANGVSGYTLLFSLIASIITTTVNIFPKPFANLKSCAVASLTLTLGCVPFAILIVDVYYSSYYAVAVIGGIGLNDGILMSTLYAPLSVSAVFSVLTYVSQTIWLINKSRTGTNDKPKLKTALFKEPN
jgi:hypothetical protein